MQLSVLKKQQNILGKEHLDIITTMSNLAVTLSDQGKINEVAVIQQDVL